MPDVSLSKQPAPPAQPELSLELTDTELATFFHREWLGERPNAVTDMAYTILRAAKIIPETDITVEEDVDAPGLAVTTQLSGYTRADLRNLHVSQRRNDAFVAGSMSLLPLVTQNPDFPAVTRGAHVLLYAMGYSYGRIGDMVGQSSASLQSTASNTIRMLDRRHYPKLKMRHIFDTFLTMSGVELPVPPTPEQQKRAALDRMILPSHLKDVLANGLDKEDADVVQRFAETIHGINPGPAKSTLTSRIIMEQLVFHFSGVKRPSTAYSERELSTGLRVLRELAAPFLAAQEDIDVGLSKLQTTLLADLLGLGRAAGRPKNFNLLLHYIQQRDAKVTPGLLREQIRTGLRRLAELSPRK